MSITIGAGGRHGSGLGQGNDGGSTTVSNSDGRSVKARGGGRGQDNGGRGWSGGGGNGGAGGHNGGDGGAGLFGSGGSGQGTGLLPTIQGVTLVPGDGGERQCSGCAGGGGGGGIIIDGGGRRSDGRAAQGYGSGGGKYGNNGQSGAVILYV